LAWVSGVAKVSRKRKVRDIVLVVEISMFFGQLGLRYGEKVDSMSLSSPIFFEGVW